MVLNSLLVLDANSLMESGTALWAAFTLAGGVTLLNILTFVKATVSGKKFKNVSDFAVVANESFKFAKGEMATLKNEIVEETRIQIVEPMKEYIQAVVADNKKLASLVVSLVAYIPLPLEVKKDAVAVTGALGNILSEAQVLLESSVTYQEEQEALVVAQDDRLNTNIDEI